MLVARSLGVVAVAAGLLVGGSGAALAAPSAAAVSRFDDGSFEYPTAPANSFTTLVSGQSIGPWKVTSGSVDLIGTGFWQAAEGDQSVDLNGGQAGAVAQTFSTIVGRTYTVTYALAANPEGGPAVKTGRVLVGGQNFQDFSFDSTGKTRAAMGYVQRQVTFVANTPTTTLGFASTLPGAYGPVIDDVRVTASSPCSCTP
ncbi:choice-of-anchor C family protein [Streptomyces albipurpureus]|uniref:Choice-of-anchor C family protein n=1 Tax=Streptomyces albipurpureus TaxID=2897419 RepID=A0ABT0UNX3_9ACTN|nr:choice-of-anchor C family protein [Streptomyces sp. CWNU-1]MCM2389795.1 choice-of-anchor C family protein [Streptomyces sp. CWNU-1]